MNTTEKPRFLIALALTFIIFLVGINVMDLITPDRRFSDSENRVLKQVPKFSWARLMTGQWMEEYGQYFADQFPWRDFWVGLKTDGDRLLGRKESNGVYLGREGQLLEHFEKPSPAQLRQRLAEWEDLARSVPQARTYLALIPNAVKVLEDRLPPFAPVDDQLAVLADVRRMLSPEIRYVDLWEPLSAAPAEGLFYKTDHHWTTRAAYYAYRELGKRMGFTPHGLEDYDVREVTDEFYGSLYSKSGFRHLEPDRIELFLPRFPEELIVHYADDGIVTDSLYFMDNLAQKDKYTVFLNGNQSLVTIENRAAEGSLLIVKDSFANCLIPFLADHFRTIYVVDLRYFTEDPGQLAKDKGVENILILYNVKALEE